MCVHTTYIHTIFQNNVECEAIPKEILTKNFSELIKDMNIQIPKSLIKNYVQKHHGEKAKHQKQIKQKKQKKTVSLITFFIPLEDKRI